MKTVEFVSIRIASFTFVKEVNVEDVGVSSVDEAIAELSA